MQCVIGEYFSQGLYIQQWFSMIHLIFNMPYALSKIASKKVVPVQDTCKQDIHVHYIILCKSFELSL